MAYNDTHRTARDCDPKDGKVCAFEVGATTIYKGDIVRIDITTGYVYSTTDPAYATTGASMFAGVALETVNNSSGSAGDKNVRCLTEGIVPLTNAGTLRTDVGRLAVQSLAANQQTVAGADAEATSVLLVGGIVDVDWDDAPAIGGAISTTKSAVYLHALKSPITA